MEVRQMAHNARKIPISASHIIPSTLIPVNRKRVKCLKIKPNPQNWDKMRQMKQTSEDDFLSAFRKIDKSQRKQSTDSTVQK